MMLIPIGRVTISCLLEVSCRYPQGIYIGFEPASHLTVMEAMYHAILPKEGVREKYTLDHDWLVYGVPEKLIVDNGPEFQPGSSLDDACATLDIMIERNPKKKPEWKPAIERFLGTSTSLFHILPGTTFSNIFKRGDYDSLEQACINLDELIRLVHKFFIDVYAETEHSGIGAIPAREWENVLKSGFYPWVPPDRERLLIDLGRVGYRVVQPTGLQFHYIRYNSPDLVSLRTRLNGKKAKFKYHPADMNVIYVYDEEKRIYIEAYSNMPEYTKGLSLWKHLTIIKYLNAKKVKANILSIAEARREMREIIDVAQSRNKKLRTRKYKQRFEGSSDVPSLQERNKMKGATSDSIGAEPKGLAPDNKTDQKQLPALDIETDVADNPDSSQTLKKLPDIEWDSLDDPDWSTHYIPKR